MHIIINEWASHYNNFVWLVDQPGSDCVCKGLVTVMGSADDCDAVAGSIGLFS